MIEKAYRGRTQGASREAQGAGAHVFTVLLFLLFVAALLTALAVGTHVYRNLASARTSTDTARLQSALIANTVRARDAAEAVRIDTAPGGGQMLVLTERLDAGDFEVRLYLQDGWIVEEYVPAEAAVGSAGAEKLTASEAFAVSWEDENMLAITTDAGSTFVALRAEGASDNAVEGGA